ncbi:uncharacterized protein EI90DRAFT_3039878 [Cantharellus anzutake]|uniref:uncharacterized protein n=1 Tax=Cantharellus anzutake TaxID=1750568 RepID=UPI0019088230|nr:uncharacterized protein EI90DRAFT_3039878 [Cantharellus anzutake]KAF8338970.1 hypothetical protein EI90DRAFT_3039878 [Cantharellus anzutake]
MNYPPVPYPPIVQGQCEGSLDSPPLSPGSLARPYTVDPFQPVASLVSITSQASLLPSSQLQNQTEALCSGLLTDETRLTRARNSVAAPDIGKSNDHETSRSATPLDQLGSGFIPLAPPAHILSSSDLALARIDSGSRENTPPSSASSSPRTPFQKARNINQDPTIYNPDLDLLPIKRMHDEQENVPTLEKKHGLDLVPGTPPVEKRQKVTLHAKSKVSSTRLTPAAYSYSQHKKLSQPFRSPLDSSKLLQCNRDTESSTTKTSIKFSSISASSSPVSLSSSPTTSKKPNDANTNHPYSRTPVASKSLSQPFRSPLLARPSGKGTSISVLSKSRGSVKRKIQALEKKINILRQARKLRLAGVTEEVEEGMKKWRDAAREAADELWRLTQSDTMGGMLMSPSAGGFASNRSDEEEDDILQEFKEGFQKGWGWASDLPKESDNEQRDNEEAVNDLENWEPPSPYSLIRDLAKRGSKAVHSDGWDLGAPSAKAYPYPPTEDEDTEKEGVRSQGWNIGSMLVSLGINPKGTLGWNDEEEDFANDDPH